MKRTFLSLCALVIVISSCTPETSSTEANQKPSPPTVAVLRVEREIVLLELADGSQETGRIVGKGTVDVSPDASKVAFTSASSPDPTLSVGEVGGGEVNEVGFGKTPVFSPDGAAVAAVVTREGYEICPFTQEELEKGKGDRDECVTANSVVVYDADDPEAKATFAIGGGRWRLVGWTGGAILAASEAEEHVRVGEPGSAYEDQIRLQLKAKAVISVSPEDLTVLVGDKSGVALQYMADDGSIADTHLLPLAARSITTSEWSPDGNHIAILVSANEATEAVVYDAEGKEVQRIKGASSVAWSEDGKYLGAIANEKMVLCPVSDDCEEVADVPNATAARLEALR